MSLSEKIKDSRILKGNILLSLQVDKYFIHIIYVFCLLAAIIWVSLMTETALSKVEKNKLTIKELEIEHTQKIYEIVKISSRNSIEEMLEDMNSDVKESEKPLTILGK